MKTKLKGEEVLTKGELPKLGEPMFDFNLVKTDLSLLTLDDIKGKKAVFNIFPSVDTNTCALSVSKFNQKAKEFNVDIINVSLDLPFAHSRYNTQENISNVVSTSDFQNREFASKSGLEITNSKLKGLLARAIICIDENAIIVHTELVDEISNEPNYDLALKSLRVI